MKFKIIAFLLCVVVLESWGQLAKIRPTLQNISTNHDGILGIAVKDLTSGDTLSIHGKGHFPMQSVYKFHLVLAVLHQVDKGRLRLDQKILLKKSDLLPNTWSPIRDKYPEGNVELPLREILKYTVAQSDNNGCDVLFRLLGGPKVVHRYIKSIGIKDVSIVATEEEMHADEKVQFTNWTTPQASVALLEKFYQKKLLLPATHDFLWTTMVETNTGAKKLKGLLPEGTIVAHKTGFSGADAVGVTAATNDIGIVQLPNGKHYAIAVFYSNTRLSYEQSDEVIAQVSKVVWEGLLND
ncbi:MAG: class A beta-lactamase, subclass A2 [Runella sp.]